MYVIFFYLVVIGARLRLIINKASGLLKKPVYPYFLANKPVLDQTSVIDVQDKYTGEVCAIKYRICIIKVSSHNKFLCFV